MLRGVQDTYNPVSTSSSLAAFPCTFREKRISSKWIEWSDGSVSPAHCSTSGEDSICIHDRKAGDASDSEPHITLHHDVNGPSVGLNQAARVRQVAFLCTERNIFLGAGPRLESIHESRRPD